MNRLCLSSALGMALMASAVMGAQANGSAAGLGGPTLIGNSIDLPMPAPLTSPTSLPQGVEVQYNGPVQQLPVVTTANVTLFECVKVRGARNIAPCAVPIVVQVPDPCTPRDRCNSCCPRPCVNVQICVPPCGCPTVCVTRHGNKTRYDYGKYAVNVISVNGKVVVDYDD